ncbi:CNDP1 dipeptidase, partial [Locustella ochotensis]|nr:CNDP1 dipeptidase [Locustella ochotensis]
SSQLPDGQVLPLPSVILGELGRDPQNPTVCFYGHVDVQPAKKEDGWNTDPYTLTEIDGNLYGRGATDNKGPVLAWINAVETVRALKLVDFLIFMQAMPVNFKFVIEGMEEAGSLGLEKLLEEENQSFFSDVDYIVISDNLWLSNKKPALTYGSRGNACFFVEVK